mgnify:CR=1 FL=1
MAQSKGFGSWFPALLLGWIIPGGGHLLLKRPARGALILACVSGMFLFGIMMRGAIFAPQTGDLLTTLPGYVKPEDFIAVLRYFGDNHYKSSDWKNYYDQYLKDNPPGSLK